jgi:hypothetical protein
MAARIGNGEHRASARSGQEVDRNVFLFEDAQDAQMSDASRESTSQGNANAGPANLRFGNSRLRVGEFPNALDRAL